MERKRMKKMILILQRESEFFPLDYEGAHIYNCFKSEKFLSRVFRKIVLISRLPLTKLVFNGWENKIDDVNQIIVFDTGNAPEIIRYINKNYPEMSVILWYWNSVSVSVPISRYNKLRCDIWTFDPQDAKEYKIKLNTQFYIQENFNKCVYTNTSKFIFYVGADKDNRAQQLLALKKYFDENMIDYSFNLVPYKYSIPVHGIEYAKTLKYCDVVQKIFESDAIIDLVAEWQTGLTLRPLEALYFKKKLITNMKNIKNYDFYNPNNIFILGTDGIDDLKQFLDSDYDTSDRNSFLEKYEFYEWLKRFDTSTSYYCDENAP